MSKLFEFDTRKAIVAAWEHIWKRQREEIAKGAGFRGQSYYTTAQDMERVVRGFAEETLHGKAWGSSDRYYGSGGGVKFRGGVPLNDLIRRWLLSEARSGRIHSHNFGKGHISGMRFRPLDVPLYEAEKATIAKHAVPYAERKPKPVHFSVNGYSGSPFCSKPRSLHSRSRSTARTTEDFTEVTCPRCLNLLTAEKANALVEARRIEDEKRSAEIDAIMNRAS